jgi:TfoX/Sxy family transcriptional regulator of competence genes
VSSDQLLVQFADRWRGADVAYNEKLAERIRAELSGIPFMEKKMFGGVGFLVQGNMACGVHKQSMIVRVDPEKHAKLLKKPHAGAFDITGKPMKGWLLVDSDGCRTAKQLSEWVKEGVEFALTLPAK